MKVAIVAVVEFLTCGAKIAAAFKSEGVTEPVVTAILSGAECFGIAAAAVAATAAACLFLFATLLRPFVLVLFRLCC